MKKLLLLSGFLCWAWVAGCAAVQQPARSAQVQVQVLEEGRDYNVYSPAAQKCQQRILPTPPEPRRVRYGKRRWIIL